MNNKKKIVISVLAVLLLIVVVSSATYAVYRWRSTYGLNVSVSVTDNLTITFDGGTNITGRLIPVDSPELGIAKKIRVKANLPSSDTFNLYLKINTLPDELKDTSFCWYLTDNDENDIEEVGNFSTASMSDYYDSETGDLLLLENQTIPYRNNLNLYLYLWIDGTSNNAASMQNQSIDFDLYATGNTEGTLSEVGTS